MKRYFRSSQKACRNLFHVLLLGFLFFGLRLSAQNASITSAGPSTPTTNWVLVVHGGAGNFSPESLKGGMEDKIKSSIKEAMSIGGALLSNGGSSVDAVEAVVKYLEDSPLFNAGKGAVLNEEGKAELDASIMDGQKLRAGSVACVTRIKNPISGARMVMEKSEHVMLVGAGAEKFAKTVGLELVDPSYFITKEQMEKFKQSQPVQPKQEKQGDKPGGKGTVGAVALDRFGNFAAATSTGGMMRKKAGRVGDSPIIGAGTYANNATCAISCTGHGEFFIRNVVAYDVSAQMEYRGLSMEEAANIIIMDKLRNQKAEGGLIGVDREGRIAMVFNTKGMIRGFLKENGETEISIY
jgi:L-asparaginase / beta-aspartyl-peptidase